jgi:transcriptional regulator with XRE-family HTH domain
VVIKCPNLLAMPAHEPTIRNRELGDGLRLAMERANLNGKQLASRLGWSQSRVSRLLTGRRGAPESEVAAFLDVCGVADPERGRLLALCKEHSARGWFQQFGSRLPQQIRSYVDHENRATAISQFQAIVVPGILQTVEYARAVIGRTPNVTPEDVDDRVAARAARQMIFSRAGRPEFACYLHEQALRLPVGDRELMSDQLHHLLRMSVRPYITVRVIPIAAGAFPGTAGSFTLLDSAEYRPVVYLENETAGVFLDRPAEVSAYRDVLGNLSTIALDEHRSKELIATIAANPR